MLPQFGKSGPILLALAITAALALTLTTRATPPGKHTVWLFDPSSARSYEALGDVNTELLPSRILAVRAMAAALAKLPCAADLVELESGFSRRALQPLPDSLATGLPEPRLALWRDSGHLMALPRDINPVVLAYRADLWQAAGIDLTTVRTWDDFFAAAKTFTAHHAIPAIELPTGNASILLLLLQQRGINLRHGFAQEPVAIALHEYNGWLLQGVSTDPTRRVELTADALAQGRLGAIFAPDWKLSQLNRLLPPSTKLSLRPLPGNGPTPTWGGTGAAIPLYNTSPENGQRLLHALAAAENDPRYPADGIVPARLSRLQTIDSDEARFWLAATRDIALAPIAGEPTAAVQRELNALVRHVGSHEMTVEDIFKLLPEVDEELRTMFPTWGQP